MADLTTAQKAPVLDQDGHPLTTANSTVFSSDNNIVSVEWQTGTQYAVGVGPGSATLTATRLSDHSTATLEVTVANAAPFSITLGAPIPR